MAETIAGRWARTMPDLDSRVLGALLAENHWRECPVKWAEESRRAAVRTVRDRIEDAGLPEWVR